MELLTSSFFWVTLAQIMMINILLSGDNAVVIALASRALPAKQQKQAILFGSFGAIFLRVILTFFAVALLALPYLKIVGAILLGWIGIQLLIPDEAETELDGHSNLWSAIKTIIVADFVMSLDNVLGVAAAAKGNVPLLVIGLAVSIPLIIYGSTLILKLMNRWPVIITIGGGILGWVAGEMLVTDPAINTWVDASAHWLHTAAPVGATIGVIGVGKWMASRAQKQMPEAQVVPDATDQPPPGYHYVTRPYRVMPDGTRDYAIYHGQREFRSIQPVSSHLRGRR
jgi:YjbE family integral membrane protein